MSKIGIIAGSTGLVGSLLLSRMLGDSSYSRVISLVRKKTDMNDPKLQEIIVDFDDIQSYAQSIQGDDLFLCMGTTISKAGSKDAFYKVDYTYNVELAKIARKNGVKKVCLISSMGANANSNIFYSKVKGQIEDAITSLNFNKTIIVRPSLLVGDRKEYRFGEKIGIFLSKFLNPLLIGSLKKYRSIKAEKVANAMLEELNNQKNGLNILESHQLGYER
jgi:uncharacterized protein YbjT (DUF2867 family)